jgi:hypothetical protein
MMEGKYFICGKIIAYVLVHGVIGPTFFSDAAYRMICNQNVDASLDDIMNYDTQQKLRDVRL